MADIPFEQILRAVRQEPLGAPRRTSTPLNIDKQWREPLREWRLDSFERLWNLARDWIEPPNDRRGGWSGVTRIEPEPGIVFYVKRQSNQRRRTLRHPFGLPTLALENAMYHFVHGREGPADMPVLYGQRYREDELQSVLVTRSLDDKLLDFNRFHGAFSGEEAALRAALRRLSPQLLALHRQGIQHGAFFAPHIWACPVTTELRLIDWERSRFRLSPQQAAVADFRQLIRRSGWLSETYLADLLDAYRGALEPSRRRILDEFHQRRTQN